MSYLPLTVQHHRVTDDTSDAHLALMLLESSSRENAKPRVTSVIRHSA